MGRYPWRTKSKVVGFSHYKPANAEKNSLNWRKKGPVLASGACRRHCCRISDVTVRISISKKIDKPDFSAFLRVLCGSLEPVMNFSMIHAHHRIEPIPTPHG
jgi:hypothetical protein